MKLIWLTNILVPKLSKYICKPINNSGGWLTGTLDSISQRDDIEITILSPESLSTEFMEGKVDNLSFYLFSDKYTKCQDYSKSLEEYFIKILQEVKPDIIHIFGTEFIHSLTMINACEKLNLLDFVVINIQGLVSVIHDHYYSNLPDKVIKANTIRDFLKNDNIEQQRKKFEVRGSNEILALMKIKHVIGRTTWDKAYTTQLNPKIKYHFCNETLRNSFYSRSWDISKCEKYSIFISQAGYPIKGFHNLLQAMPKILNRFPESRIYVTGKSPMSSLSLTDDLKKNYYQKYLTQLIKKYNLENMVTFLGNLDESNMCDRFLKSHVFVLPSSIENSPNSLGEAMILGVPSIASYVGGIPDLLVDKKEGFLYHSDESFMLSYYINLIFEDTELAKKISENSRKHASKTHNIIENTNRLLEIYHEIIKNEN